MPSPLRLLALIFVGAVGAGLIVAGINGDHSDVGAPNCNWSNVSRPDTPVFVTEISGCVTPSGTDVFIPATGPYQTLRISYTFTNCAEGFGIQTPASGSITRSDHQGEGIIVTAPQSRLRMVGKGCQYKFQFQRNTQPGTIVVASGSVMFNILSPGFDWVLSGHASAFPHAKEPAFMLAAANKTIISLNGGATVQGTAQGSTAVSVAAHSGPDYIWTVNVEKK